jgi:DNA-binding FadR family transcriptional regulator
MPLLLDRAVVERRKLVYQFAMSEARVQKIKKRGGDQVRHALVRMLASGEYPAGAKLPTERALAERFAQPRNAVRDALAALEAEGRIIRMVGSGTFVSRRAAETEAGPGSALLSAMDASPTEIMEGRLLIEPRLAALAVAHATAHDFERIDACLNGGEEADAFEEFEHWDAALHEAIAEATHNRLLVELYRAITRARDQADWGELKRRSLTAERRDLYRAQHRRIVSALRARDGGRAEAELVAHLRTVRDNLLGL